MAKEAGVGYALLRRWRNENSFVDQVLENKDEFVRESFLPFLKRAEQEESEWNEKLLRRPLTEIAAHKPRDTSYRELADAELYAPELVRDLPDLVSDTLRRGKPAIRTVADWSDQEIILRFFLDELTLTTFGRGRRGRRSKKDRPLADIRTQVDLTKSILFRPKMGDYERRMVLFALREIELSLLAIDIEK